MRLFFTVVFAFLISFSLSSQGKQCIDLFMIDFGPCDAILGYGMVDGQCVEISGCSADIGGVDLLAFIHDTPEACEAACAAGCMDLYGLDFGDCEMVLGFAMVNGQCTGITGCGTLVNGTDYGPYIYESAQICEAVCAEQCLDMGVLDFGECATPLGVGWVNGVCTVISGCSYVVNGVDYEMYFYESIQDCENSCTVTDQNTPCYVPVANEEIVCPANYDPVCGCDQVTYSNACFARFNNVLYWTPGECGITAVKETDARAISLYPNPANDVFYVAGREAAARLKIFDAQGKSVLETVFIPGRGVDINSLKTGAYTVLIRVKDQKMARIRLLVNK